MQRIYRNSSQVQFSISSSSLQTRQNIHVYIPGRTHRQGTAAGGMSQT